MIPPPPAWLQRLTEPHYLIVVENGPPPLSWIAPLEPEPPAPCKLAGLWHAPGTRCTCSEIPGD